MEISFTGDLTDDSVLRNVSDVLQRTTCAYLFEQVIRNLRSDRRSMAIKHDLEVLTLSRAISPHPDHAKPLLTCRLLLSFLNVFAHPKLSNNGFVANTISRIPSIPCPPCPALTAAIYCMIRFAASVFPAPDSPEIMTHWFSLLAFML